MMNKKTLGIILVVLIVAIAGVTYFGYQKGFFTKEGIKGIGKKSIMDKAREQGQTVMSKSKYIDECKKSDKETQDMCYGLGAFYYRDVSFCKLVEDAEAKKNCNQENIEKWYSELEKGGSTSPIMPGGTNPGGEMFPGGENTGTVTPQGEGQEEGQTGGQTTGGSIGEMTDEIYIEILAQSSVGSEDLKAYASRMKALYEKYGVTEEDVKAYASELEKDPQRVGEIGQKYKKRAMELRRMGL